MSYPQSTLDETDGSPNLKQSPDDFNSNTDHIQLDDLLDALNNPNNEQSKTHPRISKKRFEENQKITVEEIEPDHK